MDRIMTDVQVQIDDLQQYMTNLRLARERIAVLHAMGYGADAERPCLPPDLLRESETQRV
jgi:hypothetical protein